MTIPVTYVILAITVAVSLLCFGNQELKYKLTFSPYTARHHNRWYNVITHAFVHGDFVHLFFNMYVLYGFGYQVEGAYAFGLEAIFIELYGGFGQLWYGLLYLAGIVFATLPAFYKHSNNPNYLAVGASGAVSSVLFSFILFYPTDQLLLFFIPMPAFVLGLLYLAFEYFMSKRGRTNIAHDAHFAGAIFGILFTIAVRPETAVEMIDQLALWWSS